MDQVDFERRENTSALLEPFQRQEAAPDEDDLNGGSILANPRKRRLRRKECVTCGRDAAVNQFPKQPHEDAMHERSICFQCWEEHLRAQVEDKAWDAISCAECEANLANEYIKKLAASQTYQKRLDKAFRAAVEKSKGEWHTCPSATCPYGGYLAEDTIFICRLCKRSYCILCKVPMHNGETCEEYKERKRVEVQTARAEENEASEREVTATSKPCPNCSARLQESHGCDHFICGYCRHQFCFVCFAPYRGPDGIYGPRGNDAHNETCRHHPRQLPRLATAPYNDDGGV